MKNTMISGRAALALLASIFLIASNQAGAAPSFDGSRSYPTIGGSQSGAAAVATADFNGDGKPDLALATPETNGVSVLLNDGTGTFSKATHYAAGQHST